VHEGATFGVGRKVPCGGVLEAFDDGLPVSIRFT
jgi:hypothetical protein